MDRNQELRRILGTSSVNHKEQIMAEPTLKGAHSYCVVNNVSSQQVGPFIESYVINGERDVVEKVPASECRGDFVKNGVYYELKVSLGGSNYTMPKYNYVQLRPGHNIDRYMLTAFHLSNDNVENGGELYIFDVPSEDMKSIIAEYGTYAHGTYKENGIINRENLGNFEYAIRPKFGYPCWERLMNYRIQ